MVESGLLEVCWEFVWGTLGWYFCILLRFIGVFEFSYVFVLGVFVVLIVPFLFGLFVCLNVVWVGGVITGVPHLRENH